MTLTEYRVTAHRNGELDESVDVLGEEAHCARFAFRWEAAELAEELQRTAGDCPELAGVVYSVASEVVPADPHTSRSAALPF